jgi:hypothetical protein
MPETEKRKYVLEAEGKITSQTDWGFCWSDSPEAKAEKQTKKSQERSEGGNASGCAAASAPVYL